MEQQANELTPQQATSGKQVNVVILTRMGHNQTKDIIDLINNVSQGYSDTVFTVVGKMDDGAIDQLHQQPSQVNTIGDAIAQSTSRWMMFCDCSTRLASDALQRLVSKADEKSANAVIAGLDRPNEGIFTLQDKLFATEVLKGIDVSEDDVRADGYITLQRIMMKSQNVVGLGESILTKIDLNKMRSLLQPAHKELLYRMTTLYVEIQLCDRCNLDCAYCSHLSPVSKPVTISLETLEAECHRLAHVGVDEVNLMGGEPLLHPQVCEAIKLTRSILPNIKLIVSTNGLLLPRMSKDFWQCCRDNRVVLRITPYPKAKNGTLNYFKYVWLIRKNRVRMESTGWRFGFRHQLLSEKAEYDATSNYLRCQLHCTQVRDATLWPCAYVAYAFNLNNKFGTNFKTAAGDSLPLDGITATDLRLWLLRTKPFCAHCGIKDAQRITWRRSQYTRDEWLKE